VASRVCVDGNGVCVDRVFKRKLWRVQREETESVSRKTIGYRLFGWGRIPKRWRAALQAEGIRIVDEGIRVDVTMRGYRAPGRRFAYRRQILSGAIVLTRKRVAGFARWWTLFNVEFDDPRVAALEVSAPAEQTLCIGLDVQTFDPKRTGRIECRFVTDRAIGAIREIVESHNA